MIFQLSDALRIEAEVNEKTINKVETYLKLR